MKTAINQLALLVKTNASWRKTYIGFVEDACFVNEDGFLMDEALCMRMDATWMRVEEDGCHVDEGGGGWMPHG